MRYQEPHLGCRRLGFVVKEHIEEEYFPYFIMNSFTYQRETDDIELEWLTAPKEKWPLVKTSFSQYKIKSELPSAKRWIYTNIYFWYRIKPYWER